MAEKTKIEWADATFNPWIGCTKVHVGCANCYAERDWDKRRGYAKWGPNGTRVLTTDAYWEKPKTWNSKAAKEGRRMRVFCASLADVFEDWDRECSDHQGNAHYTHDHDPGRVVTNAQMIGCDSDGYHYTTLDDVRSRLFRLIDATPWLDWLLLTKRPENVRRMWSKDFAWVETGHRIWQYESPRGSRCFRGVVWGDGNTPSFSLPGGYTVSTSDGRYEEHNAGERATIEECKSVIESRLIYRKNVWLLTSVSDQATADKMVPELLKLRDLVPVLGLSIEPLLGPIDLTPHLLYNPLHEQYTENRTSGNPSGSPRGTRNRCQWPDMEDSQSSLESLGQHNTNDSCSTIQGGASSADRLSASASDVQQETIQRSGSQSSMDPPTRRDSGRDGDKPSQRNQIRQSARQPGNRHSITERESRHIDSRNSSGSNAVRRSQPPCSTDDSAGRADQAPSITRRDIEINSQRLQCLAAGDIEDSARRSPLSWLIVGGESGPNARPMHPDWVRSLRDQATAAGVAFHFKQHGEWLHQSQDIPNDPRPRNCMEHYVFPDGTITSRVGKAAAGRLLDGRTWDEFPNVSL